MGASFGSGGNKRNVEINLVPMIDLMSCLTAFLLVTAVWQTLSGLETQSDTAATGTVKTPEANVMRVLLRPDAIDIDGMTLAARDWHGLGAAFATRAPEHPLLDIAAEAGVPYQDLIDAMATARQDGLARIQVLDPRELH